MSKQPRDMSTDERVLKRRCEGCEISHDLFLCLHFDDKDDFIFLSSREDDEYKEFNKIGVFIDVASELASSNDFLSIVEPLWKCLSKITGREGNRTNVLLLTRKEDDSLPHACLLAACSLIFSNPAISPLASIEVVKENLFGFKWSPSPFFEELVIALYQPYEACIPTFPMGERDPYALARSPYTPGISAAIDGGGDTALTKKGAISIGFSIIGAACLKRSEGNTSFCVLWGGAGFVQEGLTILDLVTRDFPGIAEHLKFIFVDVQTSGKTFFERYLSSCDRGLKKQLESMTEYAVCDLGNLDSLKCLTTRPVDLFYSTAVLPPRYLTKALHFAISRGAIGAIMFRESLKHFLKVNQMRPVVSVELSGSGERRQLCYASREFLSLQFLNDEEETKVLKDFFKEFDDVKRKILRCANIYDSGNGYITIKAKHITYCQSGRSTECTSHCNFCHAEVKGSISDVDIASIYALAICKRFYGEECYHRAIQEAHRTSMEDVIRAAKSI